MNEKLTREVLEDMATCRERYCPDCKGICKGNTVNSGIETLATALLEERAKPKVWDGAPDNAFRSIVNWFDKNGVFIDNGTFTRELPKTRTREIAENIVHGINGESRPSTAVDIQYVEGVLKRYAEELTSAKETN